MDGVCTRYVVYGRLFFLGAWAAFLLFSGRYISIGGGLSAQTLSGRIEVLSGMNGVSCRLRWCLFACRLLPHTVSLRGHLWVKILIESCQGWGALRLFDCLPGPLKYDYILQRGEAAPLGAAEGETPRSATGGIVRGCSPWTRLRNAK